MRPRVPEGHSGADTTSYILSLIFGRNSAGKSFICSSICVRTEGSIGTTFREAGFPDVVATNWFGFSAPAGIPPELAKRWETEIAVALQSAEIKGHFDRIGIRPGTLGSEAYTALIRNELARWREVIRAGNIRPD